MQVFDIGGKKVFEGVHQTNGIDIYVTGERTILLDSQVLYHQDVFCYEQHLCCSVCRKIGNRSNEMHLAIFIITKTCKVLEFRNL